MSTLKNLNSIDAQSNPNSLGRFGIDLVKNTDQKSGVKSRNALRESARNLSLFNELMMQTNIKMKQPKKRWFKQLINLFHKKEHKIPKTSLLKGLKIKIASGTKKPVHLTKTMRESRQRNFLVIVYLVKKFIQRLKTFTHLKKILVLNDFHFNTIGDKTNYYKKGVEFGESFFRNLNKSEKQNYVKFYPNENILNIN